jgi:hypothetical protein
LQLARLKSKLKQTQRNYGDLINQTGRAAGSHTKNRRLTDLTGTGKRNNQQSKVRV